MKSDPIRLINVPKCLLAVIFGFPFAVANAQNSEPESSPAVAEVLPANSAQERSPMDRIKEIRNAAESQENVSLLSEKLKIARQHYEQLLVEKLVEVDPEGRDQFLRDQLKIAESQDERQKIKTELKSIDQKLQEIPQLVEAKKSVAEAESKYRQALESAAKAIDPAYDQLVKEAERLRKGNNRKN